MDLMTLPTFKRYCEEIPRAERQLQAWREVVEQAEWSSFADVRETFAYADRVGKCYVFNIGGNNWRLIAGIRFIQQGRGGRPTRGVVYLKAFLTHEEYDTDKWKADYGCLE